MANPWISPKTALPKDNERVVFVVDQGIPTNRYRYEVGSYDGGTWWGTEVNGDGYATHCVACWMSLHELPQASDCGGAGTVCGEQTMNRPEQIHSSHDLESIDDVGHCKVCLQAWLDTRPWIDVTGDGEGPPHMLLEKTPPQNGHDIGKVFESIFKSLDSSGHFEGVGPGGMQAVWDGAQETLTRCDEDRSGD